ncbi:MAG TPA: hypothetical protein VEA36_03435 [Candidatus Paceibacterota bacterium]|nr:hypothetical protein [Candidatus Paceibacterota bacterium]
MSNAEQGPKKAQPKTESPPQGTRVPEAEQQRAAELIAQARADWQSFVDQVQAAGISKEEISEDWKRAYDAHDAIVRNLSRITDEPGSKRREALLKRHEKLSKESAKAYANVVGADRARGSDGDQEKIAAIRNRLGGKEKDVAQPAPALEEQLGALERASKRQDGPEPDPKPETHAEHEEQLAEHIARLEYDEGVEAKQPEPGLAYDEGGVWGQFSDEMEQHRQAGRAPQEPKPKLEPVPTPIAQAPEATPAPEAAPAEEPRAVMVNSVLTRQAMGWNSWDKKRLAKFGPFPADPRYSDTAAPAPNAAISEKRPWWKPGKRTAWGAGLGGAGLAAGLFAAIFANQGSDQERSTVKASTGPAAAAKNAEDAGVARATADAPESITLPYDPMQWPAGAQIQSLREWAGTGATTNPAAEAPAQEAAQEVEKEVKKKAPKVRKHRSITPQQHKAWERIFGLYAATYYPKGYRPEDEKKVRERMVKELGYPNGTFFDGKRAAWSPVPEPAPAAASPEAQAVPPIAAKPRPFSSESVTAPVAKPRPFSAEPAYDAAPFETTVTMTRPEPKELTDEEIRKAFREQLGRPKAREFK